MDETPYGASYTNLCTMNLRKIKQLETEVRVLQDVMNMPALNQEQRDAIEDMIVSKQYEVRMQTMQD